MLNDTPFLVYHSTKTPDYIIDGKRWDLKQLKEGTSKELLRNIAHKKKEQAENLVFDISESKLTKEEIYRQAECLFDTYYNTKHVESVILIDGDSIIRIIEKI